MYLKIKFKESKFSWDQITYSRCLKQESAQSISWIGQPENWFTFDHVACEIVD